MAENYVLVVEGLSSLEDIDGLDEQVLRNARNAINRAAERARTESARQIRQELNFPARYLDQRLTVRKRAAGSSLEAVISGQDRPTSLARFATNRNQKPGKAGVNVQVSASAAKRMNRAFLMKLRNGNLGLAIRLKKGATITGSRAAKRMGGPGSNLYLLYGPSIDQAFSTVIPGQEDKVADFLETEFLRLMDL